MRPQAYQTPEIRDENDFIIQQGTFGKKTPFVNSQNDGILDYIINNLEAIKGMSLAATIVVSSLPSAGQAGKFYLLDDGTENSGKVYIYKDKWIEVTTQAVGLSAYQIALNNGYEGTEQEWLENEVYGDDIVSAETDSDGYFIVHTRQGKTIKTALKPLVDAKASADKAKISETNSANSAAAALASQEASADSQTKAKTSETNAKTSELNAKTSENNAKSSENLAKAWAMSEGSPDGVDGNKSAKTWAGEAKASASNSASSASASQSSATASASSASDAKVSETNAAKSAESASKSAVEAAKFNPTLYPLKEYKLSLAALDINTFYPVVFLEHNRSIDVEIHSPSYQGGDSNYNQNVLAFRCFANGWSDGISKKLTIKDYFVYNPDEITIGCLGVSTRNGGACLWIRGGLKSPYKIMSTVPPVLYENGWKGRSSEVATIGSTYQGAETGNAYIDILFSPKDIPNGAAKNLDFKTYGLFEKAEKDSAGNVIKDTYMKKDNRALYDYLHKNGMNFALPDTNLEVNRLGMFISSYSQNTIKNQPTPYGQLINIPYGMDDSHNIYWMDKLCTQLWIGTDKNLYIRIAAGNQSLNDIPFTRLLNVDDLKSILTKNSQLTNDSGFATVNSSGHLVINGSELWIE